LWLVELWWDALGPDDTRALLQADNHPAEDAVRVNPLADAPPPEIPGARTDPNLPEALILEEPFDVEGSDLFARGVVTPQSRASMMVARILDPQPGEETLDMCAAPGTKTTHAAALARDEGTITALEVNPARAEELQANCVRMHSHSVAVMVQDARSVDGNFDRVMLDAPCSNLGTLARRPDARWRKTPEQITELAQLQSELLDAAANATRPGGTLVYSVCTISPEEGPHQVDRFLEHHDTFTEKERRQTLPHVDRTDGFFIARLTKDSE
jgi:16S rRNA (cytosine967-C5)-methyltransferase